MNFKLSDVVFNIPTNKLTLPFWDLSFPDVLFSLPKKKEKKKKMAAAQGFGS